MRRRHENKRRRQYDPPEGYDPPILEPDIPEISRWKRERIKESPQDELLDIELRCRKIYYTMVIARWKISKAHSIKEYAV